MTEPSADSSSAPLVLLVDDFDDGRELYETWLQWKGVHVVTASDGPGAIRCVRARRPDLILMDLRMPGMSGTEAMRQIRVETAQHPIPIVALTAHALEDERRAALKAGFDDVIAKPCLPEDLFRIVIMWLERRGGQPAQPA